MKYRILSFAFFLAGLSWVSPAFAGDSHGDGPLSVRQISEKVSIIQDYGNNVVFKSSAGVVAIDTHLPDALSPGAVGKYVQSLREIIGNASVKYVVLTHWHPDHIGATPAIREGAVVIAHQNTATRLAAPQTIEHFGAGVPAWPAEFLPSRVIRDAASLNLGTESIQLKYFKNAHTDSDIAVFIPSEKVAVLGDIYLSDSFPFVDIPNGGNVLSLLDAFNQIANQVGNDWAIIPGHGAVRTGKDVVAYRDMLQETTSLVRAGFDRGMTLEALQKKGLPAKFNSFGKNHYRVDQGKYIEFIYRSLKAQK